MRADDWAALGEPPNRPVRRGVSADAQYATYRAAAPLDQPDAAGYWLADQFPRAVGRLLGPWVVVEGAAYAADAGGCEVRLAFTADGPGLDNGACYRCCEAERGPGGFCGGCRRMLADPLPARVADLYRRRFLEHRRAENRREWSELARAVLPDTFTLPVFYGANFHDTVFARA